MMSRITLHLKGYHHRRDGVIHSSPMPNRFADRFYPMPEASIIAFAPGRSVHVQSLPSPPAAFPQGRREFLPAMLGNEEPFMMDTLSMTTTIPTEEPTTLSYSGHTKQPPPQFGVDGGVRLRPTDSDEK